MINLCSRAALDHTIDTGAPLLVLVPGFHLYCDQEPGRYTLGHVAVPARARSFGHVLRSEMDEGIARSLGYTSVDHLLQGLGPASGDPYEVYTLVSIELELS